MLSRSNNPLISASRRWTVSTVASLLTAAGALGASATFYGVGQLPGGAPNSEIRDAVITATGVLAVGNAQANPSAALSDTAVLWTPTDGLQSLDGLLGIPVPLEHSFMTASQIAATSHQVAARISVDATGRHYMPGIYNAGGPLTAVLGLPEGSTFGAANGISGNGHVIYGFSLDSDGNYQSFRWTLAEGTVTLPVITGYPSAITAFKGCSQDGSTEVGAASTPTGSAYAAGSVPYLYNTTSGMTVLPLAPGGTWAGAFGIDPTGTYTIGCGDTPANPKGELLLWTGGAVTTLGVPAAEAANGIATNVGGVTHGGTVIVVAGTLGSYLHNSYGWFDLQTALAATGADLTGWSTLNVLGINGAGTLVFGHGAHSGGTEGFVAEVSAGYLENYGKPKKTKG